MYAKPTAPRSIGGIVDDAVRLYRASFAKAWPLALCGQILIAAPTLIIQYQFIGVRGRDPTAILALFKSPTVWLSYVVVVLLALGFYNALVALVNGFATEKLETAGRSVSVGFRLLPRSVLLFVVLAALLAVCGVGAGILMGISSVFASPVLRAILVIGVAVVFIYVWGRVFLANIALIVQDAGIFKSIGISWALIKNYWWRTATVYTIALIMAMVFYAAIAALDALLGAVLHNSGALAVIVGQVVAVPTYAVLMSLLPAVQLAMYYDLKLRKEGADLASRVNALAPQ
ncbi:MAG: hypothetical protein WBF89_16065 [Steroidobacteraceae bacterium]